MPNVVKYSLTAQANTLKKGNVVLGMNSIDYGPTSATGFWNGIEVPAGGYVMYIPYSNGTGMSIYSIANDAQLINVVNQIGLQNFTTASQALTWTGQQTGLFLVNRDYENIVTDGLTCLLDASFTPSYPTTGTTWYDLSGNGNNFTLYNGASFATDNNVKVISFDGVDDYARSNSTIDLTTTDKVTIMSVWSQIDNTYGVMIYEHSDNWNVRKNSTGAGGTVSYGGFGMFTNSNGNAGSITFANQQHNQFNGNVGYAGSDKVGPGNLEYNIHTVIHDTNPSSGAETTYYGNGNLMTVTLPNSTPNYPSNNTQNLGNEYMFLGKRGSSVPTGPYKLALFLVYNKALSQSEITQNQNALKSRFGL